MLWHALNPRLSVELHQTGIFEGHSANWATVPRRSRPSSLIKVREHLSQYSYLFDVQIAQLVARTNKLYQRSDEKKMFLLAKWYEPTTFRRGSSVASLASPVYGDAIYQRQLFIMGQFWPSEKELKFGPSESQATTLTTKLLGPWIVNSKLPRNHYNKKTFFSLRSDLEVALS